MAGVISEADGAEDFSAKSTDRENFIADSPPISECRRRFTPIIFSLTKNWYTSACADPRPVMTKPSLTEESSKIIQNDYSGNARYGQVSFVETFQSIHS